MWLEGGWGGGGIEKCELLIIRENSRVLLLQIKVLTPTCTWKNEEIHRLLAQLIQFIRKWIWLVTSLYLCTCICSVNPKIFPCDLIRYQPSSYPNDKRRSLLYLILFCDNIQPWNIWIYLLKKVEIIFCY